MSEALQKLEDIALRRSVRLVNLDAAMADGAGFTDAEARLREVKDLIDPIDGKKSRVAELKKEIGKGRRWCQGRIC